MGENGLKNFKRLRFYVSDKESKRLVCSAHLPPRLVSLTVTLLLGVRTGALWEETQESRVRRQMKVFLSLARKVLRELLESNLRLVIIVLLLSRVQLFATLQTAAHQAPRSFIILRVCSDSCPLSQ